MAWGDEEAPCLDGGRNEGGLAPVIFGDARDYSWRVGDEVVHARRRCVVPLPQSLDELGQRRAGQPPQLLALDIVLVAPGPPHRGVAIADVQRIGSRHHSLGKGAAVADDEIVGPQVHTLESGGEKWQERLLVRRYQREPLQEARANIHTAVAEARVHALWRIDRGVDGGRREEVV